MKKLWILLLLPLIISGCSISHEDTHHNDKEEEEIEGSVPDGSGGIDDYDISITDDINTYNLKDVLQNEFVHTEANYYGGLFNSMLQIPSSTPSSLDEIVDIYDYCAFYKVPSFSFELNYTHNSTEEEVNTAYWISAMAPGVSGVTSKINGNQVTLDFAYSVLANSFHSINPMIGATPGTSIVPFLFSGTKITTIPYVGGPNLDVHNSDQLIYALKNHYTPVMQEGSPAQIIYDKACSILKSIIYEEMDANEKLLAIECYLNSTVVYDYLADGYASCISKYHKDNHEEISCLASAFFAEGPLLYGSSVCYGFARAQGLLSLLLGYDVKLIHTPIAYGYAKTSTDPVVSVQREGYNMNYYNAHGINLVNVSGYYGICDPTYRFATYTQYNNKQYEVRRRPAVMLNLDDWTSVYSNIDYEIFDLYEDILLETSFDSLAHLKMANDMNQHCNNNINDLKTAIRNIEDTVTLYKSLNNITETNIYCFQFYILCNDDYQKNQADNAFFDAYYDINTPRFFYYFYGYASTRLNGYSLYVVK